MSLMSQAAVNAAAAAEAAVERSKLIAAVKQLCGLAAGTVKLIDLEDRTITFKDNEKTSLDADSPEIVSSVAEERQTSTPLKEEEHVAMSTDPSAPKPPLIASPADKGEQPWWSFPTPRGQSELDRISSMTPEQRKELQRQEKKAMRRMRYGG